MLKHAEKLLKDVLQFNHPPERITSRYFREHKQLGARDRRVLLDTIYQVIRDKSLLQYKIKKLMTTNIKDNADTARKLAILAWQGDPDKLLATLSPTEKEWLVAANQVDCSEQGLTVKYSLPNWFIEKLKLQLDDTELERFAQSMLEIAPLDLRVNALKAKVKQVQEELTQSDITTHTCSYATLGLRAEGKPNISQHPLYLSGAIEVQDEGSQLLAQLLGAKRNELVIDYCAGAGGKTLAIGAAMRNTGRLYAWDTSAHRLEAFRPRLERSGLTNVQTAVIAPSEDERVKRLYGKADRVLIDSPCSGLGTLRRSPELKWRQSPDEVEALTQTQLQILSTAKQLVKKGGLLLYATCSVLSEENEELAARFGLSAPEFKVKPILEILEEQKIQNAAHLVKGDYLRLWPHLHKTDGFFAAAWQKIN